MAFLMVPDCGVKAGGESRLRSFWMTKTCRAAADIITRDFKELKMAWKNFTKTLGGSAAEPLSRWMPKAKRVIIQPKRANSHLVYIGGSAVTAANGVELNFPAGASSNTGQ